MMAIRSWFPALTLLFLSLCLCGQDKPVSALPSQPGEIIEWLEENWQGSGWGADDSRNYMRPIGDTGWKARMLAMQGLVKAGDGAAPALVEALNSGNDEMAIFAAQTFGYLPEQAPIELLTEKLKSHKNPAVRLYAADAIGMRGGKENRARLEELLATEKNRDVKKHIGYALERDGKPVAPAVIEELKTWNGSGLDSARIGKPAPDFELKALGGETVKLSDFRGKSAVVLVFIYGDT